MVADYHFPAPGESADHDPFGGSGVPFERPDPCGFSQLEAEITRVSRNLSGRRSFQVSIQLGTGARKIWVAPAPGEGFLEEQEISCIREAISEHRPDPDWGKDPEERWYDSLVASLRRGDCLEPDEICDVLRWMTRQR